jgi:hypothetical protein
LVAGTAADYAKGILMNKFLMNRKKLAAQIDLRVQEAERTDQNIPLFKVKRE